MKNVIVNNYEGLNAPGLRSLTAFSSSTLASFFKLFFRTPLSPAPATMHPPTDARPGQREKVLRREKRFPRGGGAEKSRRRGQARPREPNVPAEVTTWRARLGAAPSPPGRQGRVQGQLGEASEAARQRRAGLGGTCAGRAGRRSRRWGRWCWG